MTQPLTDTLAGTNTLAELFGPSARFVVDGCDVVLAESVSLTDNVVVRVAMLALFAFYLLSLIIYGGHLGDMVKIILGHNIGIKVANEMSYLFVKAMRTIGVMGVLTWSLLAVGAAEHHSKWITPTESDISLWAVPICIATLTALFAIIWILTRGVCRLVRRDDMGEGLELLGEATLAISTVVATPAALLFVMGSGAIAEGAFVVAGVVACVALFTYAIKSFVFFIEQKISILLWLLYICTAVLIPLGIIVSTVLHNSTP